MRSNGGSEKSRWRGTAGMIGDGCFSTLVNGVLLYFLRLTTLLGLLLYLDLVRAAESFALVVVFVLLMVFFVIALPPDFTATFGYFYL